MSRMHETDTKQEVGLHESMALQTYEFFDGGPERSTALAQFASGETTHLELEYPQLSFNHQIDQHVSNLQHQLSDRYSEIATPEYRLAEAYFLKAAQRINGGQREVSQDEIDAFQELNECVYSAADPVIVNQMLTQLWSKIEKADSPSVALLKKDLEMGFKYIGSDGEVVEVPALPNAEDLNVGFLPELSDEALVWLQEELESRFAPAKEIFTAHYNQYSEKFDTEGIGPAEIVGLFEEAIKAQGLDVDVILKPEARLLSWSSADSAVMVGENRKPIKTVNELMGVFVHEVGVHGVRSMNGLASGVEAFGVGLFTEAENLEDPSYLSFEEGLAATLQAAVSGKKEKWSVAGMGLYLTVALASAGWSPRQIQETMVRARLIVGAKSEEDALLPEKINKAQAATATHTSRVFRGTPSKSEFKTTSGATLHYAKDLAYASGKIKAIKTLNAIAELPDAERVAEIDLLLSAKFDPTNHRQKALVESVFSHDKVEV